MDWLTYFLLFLKSVLTSTGGAGVLVADAAGVLGFEAPDPDAATAQRLADLTENLAGTRTT